MLYILTSAKADVLKTAIGGVRDLSHTPHKLLAFDPEAGMPCLEEGDVCLTMGKKVVDFMAKLGWVPKNRTVTSLRETAIKGRQDGVDLPGVYMATFDPFAACQDHSTAVKLYTDTKLACRMASNGTLDPQVGHYRWVTDFTDALNCIKASSTKVPVALDLETLGLDEFNPEGFIVSISVTYQEGQSDLIRFSGREDYPKGELLNQIRVIMTSQKIKLRGANLKYDLRWILAHWGISCTNMSLDTTLVGSLLDENRSNSLNTHAKLYTSMGGYDDCVAPETLVCTDDLRWVPVGEVKPGDGLLGFDEEVAKQGERRRMRRATAVSTKRLTKPGVEVAFSNGVTIHCSDDHGFLAHRYKGNGPFQWVRAYELRPGARAMSVIDVRGPLTTWEAGYLSGLYDGEGYLSSGGMGLVSGLSQAPGPVWENYCRGMANIGLSGFYSRQKNSDGVHTSKHSGAPTLQMLQLLRPKRLLNKYGYEGKCVPSGTEKVYVKSVTPIGPIEVVSLETDCHTFVAEGIASHNSFNKTYDKGRMDLVPDDDLLIYAGGDTDATLRVSNVVAKEMAQDPKLTRFYVKLLQPASRSFERMEHHGILLDVPYYKQLEQELEQYIDDVQKRALDLIPKRVKLKHDKDKLQLSRSALIKDFMFSPAGLNLDPYIRTEKTGQPSTAYDHLKMFSDHPEAGEFIDLIKDFNGATKTLSTYVRGFLNFVRADGRLHPSYMLFRGDYNGSDSGTVTGRLSAKDPAVQCCVGETEVVTNKGLRRIDWLVDRGGAGLKVMTHTGKWRDIIGVYRNGVQPVYDVLLTSGHKVRCTGNHPFYTDKGWVRTDALSKGDTCYVTRAPHEGVHESDLLQLDCHEEPMSVGDQQGLEPVRGTGNQSLPEVDGVPEFSGGHGRKAGEGVVHRAVECGRGLRTGELLLGQPEGASQKQTEHKDVDPRGEDPDHGAMGGGIRDKQGAVEIPSGCYRPSDGGSLDEHENIERGVFKPERVVSVTLVGPRETFDLTIDRSHSFIANGVVVHNTIPKHTKWAKKLRRGYIAPPGFCFFEVDFSQGELRITACIANEHNMIKAYNSGLDLHMITGCDITKTDLDWALKVKKMGASAAPEDQAKVKYIRQNGKAGNFGLIYGMSAGGFVEYAYKSYGVKMTDAQGHEARDGFFVRYPALPGWHERSKNIAAMNGHIRSPFGRIRHLPNITSRDNYLRSEAERQAINSPVQSALSDMTQYSLATFEERYPSLVWKDLIFCMMTHDSLGGYVRESMVGELLPLLVDHMSNLPLREVFGWDHQVQFLAEGEYGPNLADMVEM